MKKEMGAKKRIFMFAARGKRPIFRKLTMEEARHFNYGPGAEGKWYERGVKRTVSPVSRKQANVAVDKADKAMKKKYRRRSSSGGFGFTNYEGMPKLPRLPDFR